MTWLVIALAWCVAAVLYWAAVFPPVHMLRRK